MLKRALLCSAIILPALACGEPVDKGNNVFVEPENSANSTSSNNMAANNGSTNNPTNSAPGNNTNQNTVPEGECLLEMDLTGALEQNLSWGVNEGCGGGGIEETSVSVGFGGITNDMNVRVEMTTLEKGQTGSGIPAVVRIRNTVDEVDSEWLAQICTVELTVNGIVRSNSVGDTYRLAGTGTCDSVAEPQGENTAAPITIEGTFQFDSTALW